MGRCDFRGICDVAQGKRNQSARKDPLPTSEVWSSRWKSRGLSQSAGPFSWGFFCRVFCSQALQPSPAPPTPAPPIPQGPRAYLHWRHHAVLLRAPGRSRPPLASLPPWHLFLGGVFQEFLAAPALPRGALFSCVCRDREAVGSPSKQQPPPHQCLLTPKPAECRSVPGLPPPSSWDTQGSSLYTIKPQEKQQQPTNCTRKAVTIQKQRHTQNRAQITIKNQLHFKNAAL